MIAFFTEFPVRPSENRAAFVAEIVAWLRGMEHQSVLSSDSEADLDAAYVHVHSPSGEQLRMRELKSETGWIAIGARYDMPDTHDRVWRTECVLKRSVSQSKQDLIRLRTECIALTPNAHLEFPKKPFLVKALLKNGWGGSDGPLTVGDQPIWLPDNVEGLKTAKAITLGEAKCLLPIIYVSASGNFSWALNKEKIEWLAYQLGGIAHVVVEPNRTFSFRLRDLVSAENVYAGTVGISVAKRGIIRRYFLGLQIETSHELAQTLANAAISIRSRLPSLGWDWTQLQEEALRSQRVREKSSLTSNEIETLYQEEIDNLHDRIRQLENHNKTNDEVSLSPEESENKNSRLFKRAGSEIYPGEFFDRIRLALRIALESAERDGLDKRSKHVFRATLESIPVSSALECLLNDIESATKKPKHVAKELTKLLQRHGYAQKSDNKHLRLEANADFLGLENMTIPKTPSDNRALKNLKAQTERALGLGKLRRK